MMSPSLIKFSTFLILLLLTGLREPRENEAQPDRFWTVIADHVGLVPLKNI